MTIEQAIERLTKRLDAATRISERQDILRKMWNLEQLLEEALAEQA